MIDKINHIHILNQIKNAFWMYREDKLDKELCIKNIKMTIDMGLESKIIPEFQFDANQIFEELQAKEDSIQVLDIISKNKKPKKWVDNYDARRNDKEFKNSLFVQYQSVLIEENKEELAYKVKKEVYQILDCTPEPLEGIGWRYKGLVFGKVQSGKTSNFIGVIAKAIDCGYDLIIVLAGLSEDLRQQTQERVDKYIFRSVLKDNNYKPIKKNSEATDNVNPIRLTYSSEQVGNKRRLGEFKHSEIKRGSVNKNAPNILVIKKNSQILKNDVLRYLDGFSDHNNGLDRKINSKTCLIIDDECDNASVLSQSKSEYENKEETKAINLNIRRIISLFERVTYIGYTATPENFVMQHNKSGEKIDVINYGKEKISYKIEKNLTLFPEDFIQIIEPSIGYLGLNEFLDPFKEYIEIIDERHLPDNKDDPYTLNDSLISAFLQFISNIYIRKMLWKEKDNNSMLLHPSPLKSNLEELKDLLIDFRKTLVADSLKGEKVSTHFNKVRKIINKVDDGAIDFSVYVDIIENIEIISVHSGKEASPLNFKIIRDRVIVGGNKLSRGFTVEGLSVSYFFRKSSRLDTLHQMARWFGCRGKSERLLKVYLPRADKEYFEFMQSFDNDLMEQIDSMNFQESDPQKFGLSLIYNPTYLGHNPQNNRRMTLTDPNKMRNFEIDARLTKPIIIRSLCNDKKINEQNVKRASDWVSSLIKNEKPYCLDFSVSQEKFYVSNDLKNGGKIYFTGISLDKIIKLYDSLEFGDSAKLAVKFIDSIRGTMDLDFQKWSVMVSRKKEQKDIKPPFFRNRTYHLDEGDIYVSSVEDPSNLEEDIFDLINDKEEFKKFLKETRNKKRTVELNKIRKEKKIPLIKIYFAKPSNKIQSSNVENAVLIGFKFPSKDSVYVRK